VGVVGIEKLLLNAFEKDEMWIEDMILGFAVMMKKLKRKIT